MTRVGRRLIEDFLLPSLNDQRYGDRLMWVDKDKLLFSIRWSHKNAAKWSLDDTVVFQDWDKMKGHFHPEMKGYYMQSKQRFRAALYKLNTVRKLRMEDKHTKMYQLVLENDKKRNTDFSGKLIIKQRNVQNNRPSVICRNTNYVEKKRTTSTNAQNLTINENSTFSMDSAATYSDSSSNSEDHCSSMSSPNTAVPNAHEVCEPVKMLRPEDIKKENVEIENYLHAINTQQQQAQLHNSTAVVKCKNEYDVGVNDSEFSSGKPYLLTYKLQPMVIASGIANPIFSVPNLQHSLTQMPLDVKCRKSPNRHLPVLPIPVYNKETVQKLAPRKLELAQPVDLSIKREHFQHVNIPVSAR